MLDALPQHPDQAANALPRPSQPRPSPFRHPVVGLAGAIGSGKSTAARALAKHLAFQAYPFATPLKRMLAALGVPRHNLYGSQQEKSEPLEILGGSSARHAMRTLGTEWGRGLIWQQLWVAAWEADVATLQAAVAADDVRFPDEAAAVRRRGGLLIWIERPGLEADLSHASDVQLGPDDCDLVLVNDARPGDLTRRLKAALRERGVCGPKMVAA